MRSRLVLVKLLGKIACFVGLLGTMPKGVAQTVPKDTLIVVGKNTDSLAKVAKTTIKNLTDSNKVSLARLVKIVFTEEPSPKLRPALKPTLRSLVLPGWGQATNREYWVIPIVYAGGAVAAWNFIGQHRNYLMFRSVLQQIVDKETPQPVVYRGQTFQFATTDYNRVVPIVKGFRRNRDLTTIGFVVGWALQTIQANVSAHLKGFEMGDNISMQFRPTIRYDVGYFSTGISTNIYFK